MILIIVLSLDCSLGLIKTQKHAPQLLICNLNFKFIISKQRVPSSATSTHRGSTTLSFFSPCYTLCLGHFEFKTLITSSSAFSERPKFFCTRPSNRLYVQNRHKRFFFWDQEIFAFCKSSSHHSSRWVPTSSAKVFFQETPAWYRTLAIRQNEYHPQVSQRVEEC